MGQGGVEFYASATPMTALPDHPALADLERVAVICRHLALLQVALLGRRGVPARARCGFANDFDRSK